MNDINNETDKQQSGSEEIAKSLETAETITENGDNKTSPEAKDVKNETHEKSVLEVKSKEDNDDDDQTTSELNSEDVKEKNESETNLKTDSFLSHEHSEEIVDIKENDQNELNNKTKHSEDIGGHNDKKENEIVECKDNINNNDKEDVKDSKDEDTTNENLKIQDNDDDNEKVKTKDNKTKITEESEESGSNNSNEAFNNNKAAKAKRSSDSSLSQPPSSPKDESDNKEETSGENNETGHDAFSEANEEIDDEEFEDVEIPEEVDELIVPDADDDEVSNAEDEEDSDDDGHDHKKTSNNEEITKDTVVDADADTTVEDGSKPTKTSEEEESCHSAIEPELVAIEEATKDSNCLEDDQSTNDDEASNNTASDPLNCLETPGDESNSNTGDGNGANSNTGDANGEDSNTGDGNGEDSNGENSNKEDDDDDVQFVETRNSPICIESDDDESSGNVGANTKESRNSSATAASNNESETQTITLPSSATITLPKNLTVTRTSARKSTARSQFVASPPTTVPQTQNRPKNLSYLNKATNNRRTIEAAAHPRQVVDTIELLDSSDEETTTSSQFNKSLPTKFRTPPKRTLLAAKSVNSKSPIKASLAPRGGMPNNFSAQIRKQPKKPAPPPLPPPTPQSNFLNAVQLQPATAGVNPPAFSALLSNKSVIIPNAFYGNPPGLRGNSADTESERRYARWLDNFITQFCNPQLVASHSCFVFLQRALKYKDFVRIKNIRTSLNINAQMATDQLNHQLMLDLRSIFLKNSKEITTHGRRFCELTCSMMQNKSVTLLVHGVTSRVIMKTCNMEIPKSTSSPSATISSSSSSPSTSNNTNSSSGSRKRPLYGDEDEYVPGKNKVKSKPQPAPVYVEPEEDNRDVDGGTKRSLRSKRAKRLDNSFSYNEDDLAEYDIEDDEETAERLAQEEIQRKIEQKRLEAQIQRQRQAKSFESAFLDVFTKSLESQALNIPVTNNNRTASSLRARLNNTSTVTSVSHHVVHNDAEDLLQATWIENVENEDTQVISDDDEPREHRVYKQQKKQKQQQQYQRQHQLQRYSSNENYHQPGVGVDPRHWPKNTDTSLYATSKNKDICVICKLSVQRIVHHYVNEHRGCEVYNSRLTPYQLEHLKRGACNIINISIYKNGQPQFEAHCIFCQKQSRFMLPYWFQHFTMHTGEYAYRCSGCGVRKPTRSLLTQHQSQGGCPEGGSVLQDYTHDVKKARVEARICTLCNFVQLHRSNIVKHLHQQHNIKQILPKHIQTIVLLKDQSAPGPSMPTPEVTITRRKQSAQSAPIPTALTRNASYVIEDVDDDDTLLFTEDALSPMQYQQQATTTNAQNQYYNYIPPYMMNNPNHHNFTWEENDPSDDMSFMICGMLDVEMNTE